MIHSQSVCAGSLAPKFTLSLALLCTVFTIGCSDSDNLPNISTDSSRQLQGSWERSGYGLFLEITGTELSIFEVTSATCHFEGTGHVQEFIGDFSDFQLDDDTLQLTESPLGIPAVFSRVDTLPAVCDNPIGQSATAQFDHVWHTFNDYYAFFNEHNVDWMSQYDLLRPTLSDQSSSDELADALIALLTPINDSHVGISFDAFNSFHPAQPKGFVQDLIDEYDAQTANVDEATYIGEILNQWREDIQASYIGSPFQTLEGEHAGLLEWGVMGDAVGYLSVNQFFANLNQSELNDIQLFDDALDTILSDLSHTQALIIDVRISPGGRDAVAIAIANRFADTERLAATKASRTYLGDGVSQNLIIRPSERINYTKPIFLITSGFSVSATEIFTLLMRSLPHVTHIGEATNGALSDRLDKNLPNGWVFMLSNEVYRDANGSAFEVTGIPPTVAVPALSKAARDRNEDSALNAVFTELMLPNPAEE